MGIRLYWLTDAERVDSAKEMIDAMSEQPWLVATKYAKADLDFLATNRLDEAVRRTLGIDTPSGLAVPPVRLAILSSCTTAQLHAGIRVAGMRRNIYVTVYEVGYGQYWQELTDPQSGLHAFRPTMILFALDAHHLAAGITIGMTDADASTAMAAVQSRVRECWGLARTQFACPVIHQLPLPVHPALMGSNEHRATGSKSAFIAELSHSLRALADAEEVDVFALNARASRDGLDAWHDQDLWHRAKQEVSPAASPMYGDLLVRIIAAKLGRSSKCLVLDLDNTVWGGVIGDDGLHGIVVGQGSGDGEAFVAFQEYARELSRRGVILAVCSKNDEANAFEPFDKHPDMVLRRSDISAFVANWSDKPSNIRAIAAELNIGLDSLVFVDDNPFERALVRQELPEVAVPEVGDDPVTYARTIADAGYFELTALTNEDRQRSGQYQGNRQREELRTSSTDLPAYLRSLDMTLFWEPINEFGLPRAVQLINKTNQFNLTTRRYTEHDVRAVIADDQAFALQLRLSDRFGDNGVIAIVIGRLSGEQDVVIDTWLMSCRVLGRQVEATTLNLVAGQARRLGARRLIGEYRPTSKNAMVRAHYAKLGFSVIEDGADGSRAILDLETFDPPETFIAVRKVDAGPLLPA